MFIECANCKKNIKCSKTIQKYKWGTKFACSKKCFDEIKLFCQILSWDLKEFKKGCEKINLYESGENK